MKNCDATKLETVPPSQDPAERPPGEHLARTERVAAVRGTGSGLNTETGKTMPLLFDSDNRFMRGRYISANGQEHKGTFGFI